MNASKFLCLDPVTHVSHAVLLQLLNLSQTQPGVQIKLPLRNANDQQFSLVVVRGDQKRTLIPSRNAFDIPEPQWTLYRGNDEVELWTHVTGDLGLILELVAAELAPRHPAGGSSFLGSGNQETTAPLRPVAQPYGVVLAGELKDIELTELLQSINICRLTGRLNFNQAVNQTEIFFDSGVISHASLNSVIQGTTLLSGDNAVLELFTWDGGNFQFQPGWTTSSKTVKRRLESILLEGAALLDHQCYLNKVGFTMDSLLCLCRPHLTDAEVDEILLHGVDSYIELQKEIYARLSEEQATANELIDHFNLVKPVYLPIFYNLINCGLVKLAVKPVVKSAKLKPIHVDGGTLEWAFKSLTHPETGMLSFQLFAYFCEQELARFRRGGPPFSVCFFEVGKQALSKQIIELVLACFNRVKEPFDHLGHYKESEFFLLLPMRKVPASYEYMQKFATTITQIATNTNATSFSCGIAGLPDDALDIGNLLASAQQAMEDGREAGRVISTFGGIELSKWDQFRTEGEILYKNEDWPNAEEIWSAAMAEAEHFSDDDPRRYLTIRRLATVSSHQKRYSLTESLLKIALEAVDKVFGLEKFERAIIQDELSRAMYAQGKFDETQEVLTQLIEYCEQDSGQESEKGDMLASAHYNLATLHHVQGRLDRADPHYKNAIRLWKKLFGLEDPKTIKASNKHAKLLHDIKRSRPEDIGIISGTWAAISNPDEDVSHQTSLMLEGR